MSTESKQMLILLEHHDNYEDSWTIQHGVSFNKQYLEGLAQAVLAERDYVSQLREVITEMRKYFDHEYVCPLPEVPPYKERPRWPSGIAQSQITPEMRAERNAINEYNNAANVLCMEKSDLHDKAWHAHIDNFLSKNYPEFVGKDELHLSYYQNRGESEFKIIPIDFLD